MRGKVKDRIVKEEPFEDTSIHYAYSCIHNFFDAIGLQFAVKYTNSMLQAATGAQVWKKEVPANLLFYIEKFKGLCAAAFTIYYSYAQRKEAIIAEPESGEPDIAATKNFMDSNYCSNPWNNFPRHLTRRQYHNPYRAIGKFCNYMAEQEWNQFLKEVTACALSKDRLDETCSSYNILTIPLRMMQLIEACHLLDVRSSRRIPGVLPAGKKHHQK